MSLLFVLFPVSGVYGLLLVAVLLPSSFLANVEEAALLPQELPKHSEECFASQSLGTYSITKNLLLLKLFSMVFYVGFDQV